MADAMRGADPTPTTTGPTTTQPPATPPTDPPPTQPSIPPTTAPTPPSGSTGRTITDRGIQVRIPAGWEGEIYRRDPGTVELDEGVPASRRRQPTSRSVLHLASFPLPQGRGDYGSGAVEIMRDDDILIVLFEFEPESATQRMFAATGVPRGLRGDDFDPNQMQRPLEGMAGVQRFFNVDGQRAFCLFVVIGRYLDRVVLAARVDEALAGITIDA
jgi:hypothetical protein